MNAFRQIVSILTAAGLVLVGSPVFLLAADGAAVTTECGAAATCTSAYAAAVTRCTTAGGASLGMLGPCSESAGQKRQCITCRGAKPSSSKGDEPAPQPQSKPPAPAAPALPQAGPAPSLGCEQAAQALRSAADRCGGRTGCLVDIAGPPSESLSEGDARRRAGELDERAAAEAAVDASKRQVEQDVDEMRRRAGSMQGNAAEQEALGARHAPSGSGGLPGTAAVEGMLTEHATQYAKDMRDDLVDDAVEKAFGSKVPGVVPELVGEQAKQALDELGRHLRETPFKKWAGNKEMTESLDRFMAARAGSAGGKEQVAELFKKSFPAGQDLAGSPETFAEQIEATADVFMKFVPEPAQKQFANVLRLGKLDIDAVYLAASAGVDVQMTRDLSSLAEGNLKEHKIRLDRLKKDVAQLRNARQALSQSAPCKPMGRAEARAPGTPAVAQQVSGGGGGVGKALLLTGGAIASGGLLAVALAPAGEEGGGGGSGRGLCDGFNDSCQSCTCPNPTDHGRICMDSPQCSGGCYYPVELNAPNCSGLNNPR
jgi:hypothetical protein